MSAAGFEITRGYAGFWVFEALLNEVRVWVFVGMGTPKKMPVVSKNNEYIHTTGTSLTAFVICAHVLVGLHEFCALLFY